MVTRGEGEGGWGKGEERRKERWGRLECRASAAATSSPSMAEEVRRLPSTSSCSHACEGGVSTLCRHVCGHVTSGHLRQLEAERALQREHEREVGDEAEEVREMC